MFGDDVPEGVTPFDSVMSDVVATDSQDRDAEAVPFDLSPQEDERAELPDLPEQERSDIPWGEIRKGIESLGLAAKTAAEVYRVVGAAITGKDPLAGVPINIPTGEKSQYDADMSRIRQLAEGK